MTQVKYFYGMIILISLFLPSLSYIKWHSLSKEDQSKYYQMAKKERQVHMQLHPNWSARDNYAKHKKKRRKRDKARDGGSTLPQLFITLFTHECGLCKLFVNYILLGLYNWEGRLNVIIRNAQY